MVDGGVRFGAGTVGGKHLVGSLVQRRADVVAHAAVNADVGAHARNVLNRADAVQRNPGRPDDGAARLDHQGGSSMPSSSQVAVRVPTIASA